ncbi:NAD(P)H-binding protein [Roseibacillus persicicus]|uniref:NmrA family transcriptional regulator n=1 Tax=Roseibacillus persicicus TaxID=454148 RepID=A0A918WFP3_9BACT|nr:NAD(P)H-binding protein [Roseibacillus persicicus]GHC41852.1 NmrA family transcriptional regulator [Roseibacillus persicicus]
MKSEESHQANQSDLTLVIGATGKTGSRVASRLTALGRTIRKGSRSTTPAFDWNREASWDACLDGVTSIYINYAGDLAIDGSTDTIRTFVNKAKSHGVRHLVLLSGRGEEEAQACERIVQESGIDWTIVRASWFNQNFSEGAFITMVQAGKITLPAGDIAEPFVDVDDIADVVVAALTQPGHAGQVYEVTGPRLLTFADVAAELSRATGQPVEYEEVSHDEFLKSVENSGAPKEVVWIMDYLFSTVLDGRNAHLCDGIERALGRPPKDFAQYAREVATTATWRKSA